MEIFGAAHGLGAKSPSLPKIYHTYPTMKLGKVGYTFPKEDPKNI